MINHLSFVTLFPELIRAGLGYGITGRALEKGLAKLSTANPRDHGLGNYRQVDDQAYGGGPGMVMMLEPLIKAIDTLKNKNSVLIMPSPTGSPFTAKATADLAKKRDLLFICGRYEGIDERLKQFYPILEYAIGDFVVSGGELPALMMADSIIRRIPGAVGNQASVGADSHEQGYFDHPHYTRPEELGRISVPAVLLSGAHRSIASWRQAQALRRTWQKRPELLARVNLNSEEQAILGSALFGAKENEYVDANRTS